MWAGCQKKREESIMLEYMIVGLIAVFAFIHGGLVAGLAWLIFYLLFVLVLYRAA